MEPSTRLNTVAAYKQLIHLVQVLPSSIAHPLIQIVASLNLSLRSGHPAVQAMFANQWVLHQGSISPQALSRLVRDTFANRLRAQYDFYHHFNNPEKLVEMVVFTSSVQALIDRTRSRETGIVLVGPHLGNFDLLGWALAQHIPGMQVITIANPPASYRAENELRRRAGLDITPASFDALAKASERLKTGGVVVTANDRPVEDFRSALTFCGKPARLPTVHIRLALKAHAPIYVAAAFRQANQYHLEASNPIWPEPQKDHDQEIISNAERVLEVTAALIRKAPQQWCMFYPIWPEALPLASH